MSVSKPTEYQKQIAALLGINISKDSWRVAAARIHDMVEPAIVSRVHDTSPTEAQLELAEQIGIDISKDSYRVCFAKIADRLDELNEKALRKLKLKPGDKVIVTGGHNLDKKTLAKFPVSIVSSVGRNGKVYFKGIGCEQAWPSQIVRVDSL